MKGEVTISLYDYHTLLKYEKQIKTNQDDLKEQLAIFKTGLTQQYQNQIDVALDNFYIERTKLLKIPKWIRKLFKAL